MTPLGCLHFSFVKVIPPLFKQSQHFSPSVNSFCKNEIKILHFYQFSTSFMHVEVKLIGPMPCLHALHKPSIACFFILSNLDRTVYVESVTDSWVLLLYVRP